MEVEPIEYVVGAAAEKPAHRVTRQMVARKARVSLAAVTYALSGDNKIRLGKATRERVRRIARQMGYRPNYVYRALSSRRTFTIGLLVPDARALRFQFYDRIAEGALGAMNRADYDPLLLLCSNWPRVEKVVNDGRLDGVIMIDSGFDDCPILRLSEMGMPLVLVNRALPADAGGRVACVYSDHDQMMRAVVADLVARGCRSLVSFSDPRSTFANARMHDAFRAAVRARADQGVSGVVVRPEWKGLRPVAHGIFDLPRRWDGIFVNGLPAVEALLAEARRRRKTPGTDFQLLSTDVCREELPYDFGALYVRPGNAVFYQQPEMVGNRAWELMEGFLSGKAVPRETRVPYVVEQPRGRTVMRRGETADGDPERQPERGD